MKQQREQPQGGNGAGAQKASTQQHPPTQDKEHSSVPKLVRQLTSEVTSLFTKELSLARSEVRESVDEAKTGVMAMTGGGVVLLAGLIVLLMAAVYGLATIMALWLSALIVGGAVTIIGLIMLQSGKSKLKPESFKPERTAEAFKHDREAVKQEVGKQDAGKKGAVQ